ncbi:MAG: DNA polymerase III subunit delta' [Inquilinaceae bacterium]
MTDGVAAAPPPPRANPVLIGHEVAEGTLRDAAVSGRLAHAWMIAGPPGIGKATLAFRFARFMLSGGAEQGTGLFGGDGDGPPGTLELAPDHPVFRRTAAGGHADLLTVERPMDDARKTRSAEIPVAEVRRVVPFLRLTPGEGGWRVVVIDEAERMNRNAANALLKILEEPPPRALLLLVTNAPGRLLPTIRSRCRRLVLDPLSEDAVQGFLRRAAPDLSDTDLVSLARLADGSPGRALALLEEEGLDLFRTLIDLIEGLPRLDLPRIHKLGDQLAPPAAERTYRAVTELLVWWLERLVRAHAHGAPPSEVVAGEAALMRRLAGTRGLDPWLEVWEKCRRLFVRADSANLDRKQTVLQAFLSLEAAARS